MNDLKTLAFGLLARLSTNRYLRVLFILPLTEFFSSTSLVLTIVSSRIRKEFLEFSCLRILRGGVDTLISVPGSWTDWEERGRVYVSEPGAANTSCSLQPPSCSALGQLLPELCSQETIILFPEIILTETSGTQEGRVTPKCSLGSGVGWGHCLFILGTGEPQRAATGEELSFGALTYLRFVNLNSTENRLTIFKDNVFF